jgi:hypothetical protein
MKQMEETSQYFLEGGVTYARWAATQWRTTRPRCPYPEGAAAREWRTGFRHWFDLDFDNPRVWTPEAIDRIASGSRIRSRSA